LLQALMKGCVTKFGPPCLQVLLLQTPLLCRCKWFCCCFKEILSVVPKWSVVYWAVYYTLHRYFAV